MISETNALNYKTTYTYDNKGNLIKRTDANNNSISYEYDNANNLVKLIDAKGNITENIYDTNNRLIQTINSLGQSSFYSYDKNGNLIQTLDNLSRPLFTYEYDIVGRMINTTNGLNNSSHIEYDKNGNVTKIFDNKNNLLTQTVYDEFNRPVQYKDINGNIELINYDLNGNIISQIDGLNRSQLFSYDVMDNLISVTDRSNIESEQVFNDLQELVGYQDPNENTTNIEYDNLGRITKELNASGGYSTYEYDDINNLIKSTNAKGQITTYKYDAVGNLIELKDDVSTIKYTYDKNYNVIKIEETDKNPIIHSYDSLNRLISVIDSNGKEIKYEYDEVGNLATLIYPDNKEVNYTYDVLGNLLTVTDWNNRLTTYTYDENNQLLKTNKYDGSIEIREYNNKSQLSRLINKDKNGLVISDNQFVYDAVGNVIVEGEENYQYDNLNRLTESNNSQYSYDNAGNIISALNNHNNISNNIQMSYSSDNRISMFNNMLLTMDIEGNLLTIPKNDELLNATYDVRNRLISLENDSYSYDALNNRISINENGIKTNFVINYNSSLSQVLMEYDEDGNPIAYYVYGIGLISKEFINGDNYVYHYDKRGSTIALTLNGIVTDIYEYDNYGELLNSDGDTINRFKYNGKYGVQTDDSGLYYMRARYYSPEMKRFINRDVIQGNITESQTFNRFSYVNGNPVSYIDPFGLSREETEKGFKKYLINYIEFGIASNKKIVPFYDATPHETIISLLKGNYDEINYIDTLLTVMPMPQARIAKIAKTTKKTNISRKSKIEGCNCFVAGTLVLTSNGYTPIEDIQIGDYVLAKDEMTGDIAYKPVEATIENEKEIIYTIVINDEKIKVSDSHPFWVENEQTWIAAEDLYIGDILQTSNGQFLPITDILIEEQTTKVYNLTVSDYHTYFVSETGFLVHNSNCVPKNQMTNGRKNRTPSINNKNYVDHVELNDGSGYIYTMKVNNKNIDVKYNENLHPDFSPFIYKGNNGLNRVEIKFSGNSSKDMTLADKVAGFKERPKGYTWHHLEDGKTMILVETDVHKTFSHTGGFAKSKK